MSPYASYAISSLGWTLVHFLWQGLLLGCATAALLTLMRNARPEHRYTVACTALFMCLAWPALEFYLRMQDAGSGAATPSRPPAAGPRPTECAPARIASQLQGKPVLDRRAVGGMRRRTGHAHRPRPALGEARSAPVHRRRPLAGAGRPHGARSSGSPAAFACASSTTWPARSPPDGGARCVLVPASLITGMPAAPARSAAGA